MRARGRRWVDGVLGLGCGVLLAGCSFSKAYPIKDYFYLTAERPGEPAAPGNQVLCVRQWDVAEAFSKKELVYRLNDVAYESDYYARFFTSPDRAVTELATRWFTDSGRYVPVIDAGSALAADRILEGTIDGLYGDFRDPAAPRAVVSLRIRFIDDSGNEPRLLFSKQYARAVAVDSTRPGDLVRGWNQGLAAVFAEMERDAAKY